MALGQNMKRRKLIPEKEEEIDTVVVPNKIETEQVAAESLKKEPVEAIKKEKVEIAIEQLTETVDGVTITIKPSKRKFVKKANVLIEGKLHVSNANFITKKIKEVIAMYKVINFKLQHVESLDLSSIQILYYFTNLYNKGEKTILFQVDGLPMDLKMLLVKTKYNHILFKKPTS